MHVKIERKKRPGNERFFVPKSLPKKELAILEAMYRRAFSGDVDCSAEDIEAVVLPKKG